MLQACGHKLRKEPHALGLACLSLGEKPNRSIEMQVGIWHPLQPGIGVSDETRERRDADTLPHRRDLR
ncbi:MAG: hypothetical protein JWQ65_2813 [Devosia sp.]|nr:hypothetical protein [Devosia sp.]